MITEIVSIESKFIGINVHLYRLFSWITIGKRGNQQNLLEMPPLVDSVASPVWQNGNCHKLSFVLRHFYLKMMHCSSFGLFILLGSLISNDALRNVAFRTAHSMTMQHQPQSSSTPASSSSSSNAMGKKLLNGVAAGVFAFGMLGNVVGDNRWAARADDEVAVAVPSSSDSTIKKQSPYTKKSSDLVAYTNIERGFRMLRPFGYNEFEGQGGGYAVKFASLTSSDENVVVGSAPASAGKTSILDYGTLDKLGEKLAAKRGGTVVSSEARDSDGVVFYQYEFENPLDESLPRVGRPKPTKGVELYELCVAKGRLWSVQATSNNRDFAAHADTFRNTLKSFQPKM